MKKKTNIIIGILVALLVIIGIIFIIALSKNEEKIQSFLSFVSVLGEDMETSATANSNNGEYLAHKTYSTIEGATAEGEWKKASLTFYSGENDTARLALVPIGLKSEKLCYEFSGEYDGSTYYVYIDANTGRQVEMFKVIESTEGTLLM